MATVSPYLNFNGNCEEVFNFYKSIFGGEFSYFGRYSEMPSEQPIPESEANKVMHVSLNLGNTTIMGSDVSEVFGQICLPGNNINLSINADSMEEANKIFNELSVDGKISMPMQSTFWGAYFGSLEDKFGINWMINFDEAQNQ